MALGVVLRSSRLRDARISVDGCSPSEMELGEAPVGKSFAQTLDEYATLDCIKLAYISRTVHNRCVSY